MSATVEGASMARPALAAPYPARTALVLLLLINLCNYADRSILYSVYVPVSQQFGASDFAMGWLATAFLVSYMLLSPLFGWLADRTRRWLLVGIGVILWSLASGASGLATSYAMLLVARCMIGVGEAAYGPIAPALISDVYPVSARGRVLAWFYAAIPVGSALGYLLGGLFAQPDRWHYAFLLTVPPGLVLGAWCFFLHEPTRGGADAVAVHRAPSVADYVGLLRIRSYVVNTAGMTAMTFAMGGVAAWMPTYLVRERMLPPQSANAIFGAIVVVAGLLATLAGGVAGDRLRARFPGSYLQVSAAGMLLGFPLFLLMLVTPFPLAWVVMFAGCFCLFFNTGPSNAALANVTPASIRATGFAANILVTHLLGDAISPPIIGWIADRSSLTMGFVVISGTMVVSGVLWLLGARSLEGDTRAASLPPR